LNIDLRSTQALRVALDPASIAVVGASDNPNKVGGRPLRFLQRFGFKGEIYPVNPTRNETQGLRTWARVHDLPNAPDVAIIAVAGDDAFRALDDCAEVGTKVAVVMTGGLTESDPVHGKEIERQMVARARKLGMRIVGPNAQGLANFGTGAIASFSTMFVEVPPQDGPVGIVSQSGAMSVVPYGLLRQRGIGIRHAHATGNDSDVTACELAAIVAEDPELKLLLLYLEGLPDPHQLARAAAVARDRHLPIIAIKGGRTAAGQAAAASHTGALASEDRVIDAFFEQHGILRARDMAELVSGVELYLKGWQPRGRRLVAISTSGATCVMAADTASAAGMPMARFTPQTTDALREALPPIASPVNPVDLTGAILTDSSLFGRALSALASEPTADAFFVGMPVTGAGYDVPRYAREAAAFSRATGKPLVFSSPQNSATAPFRNEGVPAFEFDAQAVNALERFLSHHELMARTRSRAAAGLAPVLQPQAVQGDGQVRMLNEADSLSLLARGGVPVVEHRACRTLAEALNAFRTLGAPVAVKGCSSAVAHKTELGIVRLGLRDETAVEHAWHEITATFSAKELPSEGVIVARMARGRHEMMIGAHRDPVFGPAVVFGTGGKYVEATSDVRLLLPPFSADDVRVALLSLRIAPLLAGVRGEPPVDVQPFIDAVLAVQHLFSDPGLHSIDLNPVFVGDARSCSAVDAVVFKREPARG
jgi:acetate---CoA ligase (ADP-forming)